MCSVLATALSVDLGDSYRKMVKIYTLKLGLWRLYICLINDDSFVLHVLSSCRLTWLMVE